MASRTPSLRREGMISATSPNQEGVEGTDAEEVWMITEESAILVMSTSLIGKDLYPSLKGGTFYVCSLQATSRCAIRGTCKNTNARQKRATSATTPPMATMVSWTEVSGGVFPCSSERPACCSQG